MILRGGALNVRLMGAVLVWMVAASTSVQAVPVSAPIVQTYVTVGNTQYTNFGSTSQTTVTPAGGMSGTSTANLTPSPNIGANITTNVGVVTAYSQIEYFFQVSGPTGVDVPILIAASGGVSPLTSSSNVAYLYFGAPGATTLLGSACQAPTLAPGNCSGWTTQPSFSVQSAQTVTAGVEYFLQLTLYLTANGNQGVASATGYLDPIVLIDPTFSRAGEFALLFSQGVGNTPLDANVPVPAALPLFFTALAAMGGARLRRRRRAARREVRYDG